MNLFKVKYDSARECATMNFTSQFRIAVEGFPRNFFSCVIEEPKKILLRDVHSPRLVQLPTGDNYLSLPPGSRSNDKNDSRCLDNNTFSQDISSQSTLLCRAASNHLSYERRRKRWETGSTEPASSSHPTNTIASCSNCERSSSERKEIYGGKKEMLKTKTRRKEFMLFGKEWNGNMISSAGRKVIKQLTSIEYSLVFSRPYDGQVHVLSTESALRKLWRTRRINWAKGLKQKIFPDKSFPNFGRTQFFSGLQILMISEFLQN